MQISTIVNPILVKMTVYALMEQIPSHAIALMGL